MSRAFTEAWFHEQADLCRKDGEFQSKIAKFDRSVTVRVRPSPDHGVTDEYAYCFEFPTMEGTVGPESTADGDYVLDGDYDAWHRVNEGLDELVPALMNQTILVPKGSVSYVARFLPAIERYMELARSHTDSYDGDFQVSGTRATV
jgi:hypothetical protein